MKKRCVKALCVLSFTLVILVVSACTKNPTSFRIENGGDFVYITKIGNTKCAATTYGYMTSDLINSLQYGDCYLMEYVSSSKDENGFFVAEESTLKKENPLRRFAVYDKSTVIDDLGYSTHEIDDLGIFAFDPYLYYGDNWYFKLVSKYDFDNADVRMRVVYDENNQFDKNGSDVSGTNRVILDLIFDAKDGAAANTNAKSYDVAVNMNNLRMMYVPDFSNPAVSGDTKYVNVLVQFRLRHGGQDEYIGDWNGSNSPFYLSFVGN